MPISYSLVLSGGAAYGLANAGVINVLEREGLRPTSVAGSSMGAIVGALYAYTADVHILTDLMNNIRAWNIAALSDHPLKSGLHGGIFRQRLREHLSSVIGDATIDDCTIPFLCVAGKVTKPIDWMKIVKPGFMDAVRDSVELHIFDGDVRLIDAIMASSAIPVMFSPVQIGDDSFIDLVHFGAIPARTAKKRFSTDIVIATDTSPRYPFFEQFLPAPWKEFLQEGYNELDASKAACNVLIQPQPAAGLFRFDKAAAFVQAGEEATEKQLEEIKSLLE